MSRKIIKSSAVNVSHNDQVLVNANDLVIGSIYADDAMMGVSSRVLHKSPLVEVRGSGCKIGGIYTCGILAAGSSLNSDPKSFWMDSVRNGVLISGDNNTLYLTESEYCHIPLMITGKNNKVYRSKGEYFSGDGFNVCNNGNEILSGDYSGGMNVFSYEEYHTDVGMMYHKDGDILENCIVSNIHYSSLKHPLYDDTRQGILSDGLTVNCHVINFTVSGVVNPEHGVSFADSFGCSVVNERTNGAINWNKKAPHGVHEYKRGNLLLGVEL